MKKFLAIIVSALLVTGLAACGAEEPVEDTSSAADSVVESVAESTPADEADSDESKADESKADRKEKDLSAMKNPYVVGDVAMDMPEGFTVDDDETYGVPIATPEDYPTHSDNITFYATDDEEDMELYTKEAMEEQYSGALEGFSGVDTYEKCEIDGIPAIKASYAVSVGDTPMKQSQVILFYEGGTCAITFTSVSGDYEKAFEEAIKSIVSAYEE